MQVAWGHLLLSLQHNPEGWSVSRHVLYLLIRLFWQKRPYSSPGIIIFLTAGSSFFFWEASMWRRNIGIISLTICLVSASANRRSFISFSSEDLAVFSSTAFWMSLLKPRCFRNCLIKLSVNFSPPKIYLHHRHFLLPLTPRVLLLLVVQFDFVVRRLT